MASRAGRNTRRALIAVVVVIVVLVAADFVLRAVTQRFVAQRIEQSLHLSERPSVSLHGFPFLWHFAEGRFGSASAKAEGFRAEDVAFGSVALSLQAVRFPPGRIVSGRGGDVRAETGSGAAEMTSSQATAAPKARGVDGTVRFVDGKVLFRSPQLPRDIPATVSVSGRRLVIRSADPSFSGSFDLALPQVLPGLRFTGVTVQGSVAVFRFVLDHPVFRLG